MIFHTNMKDEIKSLFFEETLKRWHFGEIVAKTSISRERVNHFLKELLNEKIVFRKKEKRKMPYYLANREHPQFRIEKVLQGLSTLEKSGLLEHIRALNGIKTAILFGSFARGDWNKSSDIDLFIYGDSKNFEKRKFENKIKREIQLFSYNNAKQIKKDLDSNLITNIIKGYNIKGNLEPFKVEIDA